MQLSLSSLVLQTFTIYHWSVSIHIYRHFKSSDSDQAQWVNVELEPPEKSKMEKEYGFRPDQAWIQFIFQLYSGLFFPSRICIPYLKSLILPIQLKKQTKKKTTIFFNWIKTSLRVYLPWVTHLTGPSINSTFDLHFPSPAILTWIVVLELCWWWLCFSTHTCA